MRLCVNDAIKKHLFIMFFYFTFTLIMQSYKSTLVKLATFIIAMQILNLSIDSPNTQADNYNNTNDSFNYIDTYVEYFLEVIMKYENAVPETGKRHQKELQLHKLYRVICDNVKVPENYLLFDQRIEKKYFDHTGYYVYQFIKEITPPPKHFC